MLACVGRGVLGIRTPERLCAGCNAGDLGLLLKYAAGV